jgi:membrane protease subunit HflK
MNHSRRIFLPFALLLFAILLLITSLSFVGPGEVVVVRRLGRLLPAAWGPGLHVGWPFGLETRTAVRTGEIRRLSLGDDRGRDADAEFWTADLNLVRLRAALQYRVADPAAFLLRVADAEQALRRAFEAALAVALARRPVDDVVRGRRAEAARMAADRLARDAERLGLGVAVLDVSLTDVRPPDEVAADFAAAQASRSARDRRLQEAATEASRIAADTDARAASLREQAAADAHRARTESRAAAARFEALLSAARAHPELTRRRLYLERMAHLLGRVGRKVLLETGEPIDLGVIGER